MADLPSIPVCRPHIPQTALAEIGACLASGWLGYGPRCKQLEARFAARGGAALATANCTAALHITARLCASPGRNEVIIPAITFVSTAMSFRYAGYDVRLVDINPRTGLLDTEAISRAITPSTRAIVAVHLFGQRSATGELRNICDAHGLVLIEDCAHRLDLLDVDPPLGDMACYSFNAVKEAPGGEGGLLWCRDPDWIMRARWISNLGLTVDTQSRAMALAHHDYEFSDDLGLKLRSSDLSAALTLACLDGLARTREARRHIFMAYDSALLGHGNIAKPIAREADDSFLMYVLRIAQDKRDALRKRLAQHGIATSIHYPSLSRQCSVGGARLPCAEQIDRELVTLPCFPDMLPEEIDRVTTALTLVCEELGC